MMLLEKTIESIRELDAEAMEKARSHQKNLIKPYGSLGMLEDVAVKIAGITGEVMPQLENKAVITCAGDHGVAAQRVSVADQEVTQQMVKGFLNGGAAINVITRHTGAKVICVDMGMIKPVDDPRLVVRRVGSGTNNIAEGPAMTREQARAAVEGGIEVATEQIKKGTQLLATGDMGIGNTTPSTAVLAAFTGFPVDLITGKDFLHNPGQAVDFINKQNPIGLQVSQYRSHIPCSFQSRARCGIERHPHLSGDNMSQGGFTQTRRPVEQHMIQGLFPLAGCFNKNLQVFLELLLPDKLPQRARPQRTLCILLLGKVSSGYDSLIH
jgi:hypothetical protein